VGRGRSGKKKKRYMVLIAAEKNTRTAEATKAKKKRFRWGVGTIQRNRRRKGGLDGRGTKKKVQGKKPFGVLEPERLYQPLVMV